MGICRVLGILLRVKLVAHHLQSSKNTSFKVKQAGGSERNGVRGVVTIGSMLKACLGFVGFRKKWCQRGVVTRGSML